MKPTTVTHWRQWKQEQRKFATPSAYDASFAKLFEEQGIKVLLVGDSLGMTLRRPRLHAAGHRRRHQPTTRAVRLRRAGLCCWPICRS